MLTTLFARADHFRAVGSDRLRPDAGGRLFVFGCGDGWTAARATCLAWDGASRVVPQAVTSLGMVLASARLTAADRGIAISMSGSVDRTNTAAQAIEAAGGTCVALTNEDGGPLGAIASTVASLHVPDVAAFLTGTARYSATVLALMFLLEGALGARAQALDAAVADFLVTGLPALLAEANRRTQAVAANLADQGLAGIRVLGAGSDWGTAEYGAAKLVKLYDGPVWGAEIEEYAHSQFWSANAGEVVVLLAGSAESAHLAGNTASALREAGMRTVSVETSGHEVKSASHRIRLPAIPTALAPIAQAIPLQLLAYHLSIALGGNPNMSQDKGDPARFLAAQLLSRRCELAPAS